MSRKLILFFLTSIIIFHWSAASIFPKEQFQKIYGFDIDTSISHKSVSNPYEVLAENYEDFIFLMLRGEEDEYNLLKDRHSNRIDFIASSKSADSIKVYCSAEINLQWAVLNWRYGDYVKSGINIRKAYRSLEDLKKEYPEFIEVNKSLGLLHILLSAIPDEYQWLIKIFGFENNFDKGYKELLSASKKENFFRMESALLLSYVELFVLDNQKEGFEVILNELEKEDNLINSLAYIVFCHKHGRNEDGLAAISEEKWITSPQILWPMISLLKAEMYLKKLDFKNAQFYLKNFLLKYSGSGFTKNAELKLFYSYYLNDEEEKAISILSKKNGEDENLNVSDKYANEFFKKGKKPNKNILKARLLFDGGYYKNALEEIKLYNLSSYYDREEAIEYYYRIGRIYQKLDKKEESIKSLNKCIEMQKDGNYYFAPNACLQLGYIFQQNGDILKSKEYFEKALSYKNYSYRRSIEHQAKSALNALH